MDSNVELIRPGIFYRTELFVSDLSGNFYYSLRFIYHLFAMLMFFTIKLLSTKCDGDILLNTIMILGLYLLR